MSKKSKKHLKISNRNILFVILVLLIGFCLVAFQVRSDESNPKETESNETNVLIGLSDSLGTNAIPRQFQYANWINNQNTEPLIGKQILLGTSGSGDVGKYGNFTTDELDNVNEEFLVVLQDKIKTYFESEGFVISKDNSGVNINEFIYSQNGFQKGNIKCISQVAKNSDPFGYISCGVVNNEQIKLQKELSNVYSQQKKDYDDLPIIFRVDKLVGNFASGSTSYLSGNQWIAKKINNNWTTVWNGQDFPLCSDMAKYEVPSDFYPGCYNPSIQDVQKTY